MKTFAFVLIFLATSLALADEKLYIVLDNSKNSQLLKAELTRDWISGKRLCSDLYALDNQRIELQHSIVIVDSSNPNERIKHEVPYLRDFPSYRVGKYKAFYQFPERAFLTSSHPLLTTVVILNNSIVDEIEWKQKCEEITENARSAWRSKVVEWVYKDNFDEAQQLFNPYIYTDSVEGPFKKMETKYRYNNSFPKYVAPKLPKNPVMKYPFEVQ